MLLPSVMVGDHLDLVVGRVWGWRLVMLRRLELGCVSGEGGRGRVCFGDERTATFTYGCVDGVFVWLVWLRGFHPVRYVCRVLVSSGSEVVNVEVLCIR